jgi:hypothetical protein
MPRINLPLSVLTQKSLQSLQSLKKIDLQALRSAKGKQYSAAGIATAGAAAMALTLVPGSAGAGEESQSPAAKVSSAPVAFTGSVGASDKQQDGIARQLDAVEKEIKAEAEKKAEAKKEKAAAAAAEKRAGKQEASRSHERSGTKQAAKPTYANNLNGWIREAMAIMDEHNIPGSYEGIHRNIMRESSGDPRAINNWDVNARNGVPSKGLLQVIKPTFDAYHVPGTSWSQYDPVANIVAACNYAADRYGTIDNVDSAY